MEAVDLFGGLSDSDTSDNEDAKPSVLQDLEMSCSSDEEEEDDLQQLGTEMQKIIKEERLEKSLVKEPLRKVIFTLSGDEDDSNSMPIPIEDPHISLFSTTASESKLANDRKRKLVEDEFPIIETPKRHKSINTQTKLIFPPEPAAPVAKINKTESVAEIRKPIPAPLAENASLQNLASLDEVVRLKDVILLGNFSKDQMERYEAYRRSSFNKQLFRRLISDVTGTNPSDQLVLAIRSLTKMFVGDIVEEAVELRATMNEEHRPVQPHHIHTVFNELASTGKLWPPYGSKF